MSIATNIGVGVANVVSHVDLQKKEEELDECIRI